MHAHTTAATLQRIPQSKPRNSEKHHNPWVTLVTNNSMLFIFIHPNFTHMFQLLQHQAPTESVGTSLCHHNLSELLKMRKKNSTGRIFINIFNRNNPSPTSDATSSWCNKSIRSVKYAGFGEYAKLLATFIPIKYFLNTSQYSLHWCFKDYKLHTHAQLSPINLLCVSVCRHTFFL